MRRSWKFIGLLALSYWILAPPVLALPEVKKDFPRLTNYFLHWTISEAEARELAKWDLLILDMETQVRNRRELELIRQLNPKIILLAYITPVEIRQDVGTIPDHVAPLRRKLATSYLQEVWYLTDVAGARRSFWPGTFILNITQRAPTFGGGRLYDALPLFVKNEIMASGIWDGIFYDNGWGDPSHHTGGGVDLDRDGIAESIDDVNRLWIEGMKRLLRNTKALLGDQYLVAINGNSPAYGSEVNGVMFEYFPRQGWQRTMAEYTSSLKENRAPSVTMVNRISPQGLQNDYKLFRHGLASTLLADGFYSFDYGVFDHGQIWWYDEYGATLGEPLNPARSRDGARQFTPGIWRRDFENGMVVLNATEAAREVTLPIEVERIRGTQDTAVNDGRVGREIRLDPQDGIVVLRPLRTIVGAPFENGVFARVFNLDGVAFRAGFFALERKEASGVTIAQLDLDGDGKAERIRRGATGAIEVFFGDGRYTSFFPFGEQWKGEVTIALGDLGADGVREMVVGQGKGGGQLRVFRPLGTPAALPFFPFGERYRGGVNVAVGDLNGDGNSQIVVGAGPGGGPQVRVFSGEGRLLSGGFFAYDPRFRGGVHVAVGDLDGDGAAEIVTGPGIGGGPQIRIFDRRGRPVTSGFFAFDRAARLGATPIVTDVDGDGRNEILAVTKEIL